jgi:RNA polymerase II-associated protein 2
MAPKSILKSSTSPPRSFVSRENVNPRHLEIALHHANIIEQQKKTETDILRSIITLLDYPTRPDADPARPSPDEAAAFCNFLVPFQPSDYDALIEERNAADRCGYALCPKPPKKAPSTAPFQFVETEAGVEIVEKRKLEVWCSDDCARRALYIKVQLNEEPAWTRRGGIGKIELLADNEDEHHKALPLRLKDDSRAKSEPVQGPDEADEEDAWAAREGALDELARERGEVPGQPTKATSELLKPDIQERTDVAAPVSPFQQVEHGPNSHLAIEGHVPKKDAKKGLNEADDDSAEEGDGDWNLT